MWGFPWLTSLGIGMMLAIMITTWFVPSSKQPCCSGMPFVMLLSVIYYLWYRKPQAS